MIPWTVAARLLCPWNSPGKNTGVGSDALLQGDFLTQGLNPGNPALSALPSEPPGKPISIAIISSESNEHYKNKF